MLERKTLALLIVFIICLSFTTGLLVAQAQTSTIQKTYISKYSGVETADIIIFLDGQYVVAKEGKDIDNDGVLGEVVSKSTNFADTIQDSINKLANIGGGIICLKGTFTVNVDGLPANTRVVTLKSDITIFGSHSKIVVEGTPSGEVTLFAIVGSSSNFVENVEIRGLEIDLSNTEKVSAVVVKYGKNIRIVDNKFVETCDDSSKDSVAAVCLGSYGANITYMNYNVWIENNKIDFRGVRNAPPLLIYWSEKVWVRGNWIKGSDPDVEQDPAKIGPIQIQGVKDAIIEGNYIYRGHHNAIFFADDSSKGYSSENVLIKGNIFYEYQDDAIDPNNDKKIVIVGNVFIHGSSSLGWVSSEDNCEDVVIVGNYMFGSGYIGGSDSKRIAVVGNVLVNTVRNRNYMQFNNCEDVVVEGNMMYNATCGVITKGSTKHVAVIGNIVRLGAYNDNLLYAQDSSERIIVLGNIYDVLDGTWARIGWIEHTTVKDVYFLNNLRGALGRAKGPGLGDGVDPLAQNIVANYFGPDRNIGLEYPSCAWRRKGTATLSGNGTTTDFLIGEHGLDVQVTDPSKVVVIVTPVSADAIAASPCVGYLSDENGDGIYESIRVKFASAPASGTDNVKVAWEVEYIG